MMLFLILFNSLRNDYTDFNKWFLEKSKSGYFAYITENEYGNIASFLLLQEEKSLLFY